MNHYLEKMAQLLGPSFLLYPTKTASIMSSISLNILEMSNFRFAGIKIQNNC